MKGGAYLALRGLQAGGGGGLGTPAHDVPVHAGRGDRLADQPGADRGFRPDLGLCAGHRAGARRRQGRHGAQGGRALRRACGGQARPFRRAARGGAQRHPRGRAADPRGRGADGLRQGRHHHSGHDAGRHGGERDPAACALLRRPARHLGGGRARPSPPPSSGSSRTIPTSGSPSQAG